MKRETPQRSLPEATFDGETMTITSNASHDVIGVLLGALCLLSNRGCPRVTVVDVALPKHRIRLEPSIIADGIWLLKKNEEYVCQVRSPSIAYALHLATKEYMKERGVTKYPQTIQPASWVGSTC